MQKKNTAPEKVQEIVKAAKAQAKRAHADQVNTLTEVVDAEEDDSKATPGQLAAIINIGREQVKLMRAQEKAEDVLKKVKDDLWVNKTELLPKAMKAAGYSLGDKCPLGEKGAIVDFDSAVSASVPSADNKRVENAAEKNAVGIAYLDDVFPDIVETTLTFKFQRGEHKDLAKFLADNRKRKKPLEVEVRRVVNTNSLSAWVRRKDAAGESVDDAALNVYREEVAKVVLPKVKKALA